MTTEIGPSSSAEGTSSIVSSVPCKYAATLLPNNLSRNPEANLYAYVHDVDANLVLLPNPPQFGSSTPAKITKVPYEESDLINQAKWVKLSFGYMLVVVSVSDLIQVYADRGQKLLHFYRSNSSSKKRELARGIASNGNEKLFIGSASGEILQFQLSLETLSKVESLAKALTPHEHAITDISSDSASKLPHTACSVDEAGRLAVWDLDALQLLANIEQTVHCNCMSLGLCGDIVVAAFLSGNLLIHHWPVGKSIDIAAHTRSISAIAIDPIHSRVACASEDTFISVYALPAVPDGEVEKLYCSSVMPALLTGIQFGGDDNEYLVVSAYDHSELTVISNI